MPSPRWGSRPLLAKWWSEDWRDYLTVCGAVIGWTRGTGLMSANDVLATGIEEDLGVRTFSANEMAWHIVGLMDATVAAACDLHPLVADLSGGLGADQNLKAALDRIQAAVDIKSEACRAVYREKELAGPDEQQQQPPKRTNATAAATKLARRARIRVDKSALPGWDDELAPLAAKLEGMVDLDRVVVAVGFGEIGPYGSARTRWEAECSGGIFSVSGCVELAWVMGLIRYHNGPLPAVKGDYCGWVDAKAGTPLADRDIKARFEQHMLEHTGIRVLERKPHDSVDADQTAALHEISVTEDLAPLRGVSRGRPRTCGASTASASPSSRSCPRRAKRRCSLSSTGAPHCGFPRRSTSATAAWARSCPRAGTRSATASPDDIISQVDPVTLHALVATAEALVCAGVPDPVRAVRPPARVGAGQLRRRQRRRRAVPARHVPASASWTVPSRATSWPRPSSTRRRPGSTCCCWDLLVLSARPWAPAPRRSRASTRAAT